MSAATTALSFASKFNCYKEYDRKAATINITGTVPAGNFSNFATTVTLLRDQSITSTQFATSVNSTYHNNSDTYLLVIDTDINHTNGSTAMFPGTAPYDIFFQNSFNGNTVTLTAAVLNPNSQTLTVVNETLSFTLYSIIAPW